MKQILKKLVPQRARNYYHFGQSFISNLICLFPSRKLTVIGVTGTDGKTTTVNLIYHLLKKAGKKVSMISTVSAVIGDETFETGFHVTSPDPWLVPKYIKKAVAAGSEYIVLEVTSHALDQYRMAGIFYDVGVLTNVTQEHLDYHKTYERYLKTKSKLLKKSQVVILNVDDESFEQLKKICHNKPIITYGILNDADISAQDVSYDVGTTKFTFSYNKIVIQNYLEHKRMLRPKRITAASISPLLGDYNLANVLAAFGATLSLGIDLKSLIKGLQSFKTITGRLEEIDVQKDFRVIIDFAHTPGSFKKLLPLAQNLVTTKEGRVIHIFGAAGLRDAKKRPLMGEISGANADITILTAEDPRTEDVNEIIKQIAIGCQKSGMKEKAYLKNKGNGVSKTYYTIPDRQEAISFAINKLAKEGDLILITGKGHEISMCYGKEEFPWSDHEAVEKALLATQEADKK